MLSQLKVRNFKSLEDVVIPLDALTVVVGPNNAGKSNIFDCLLFLKELTEQGTPAVHSRGGFSCIVWGGDLKRTIRIEISGRLLDLTGKSRPYSYGIEIAGGPTHFALAAESFVLHEDSTDRVLLEYQPGVGGMALDEVSNTRDSRAKSLVQPYLVDFQNPTRYPTLTAFFQCLHTWAFYNFVPARMGVPQPARKDLCLQREGENVASVLHTLHSEYGASFSEIESLLKTGVPEVRQLLTALTEQGQTYLTWEENGFSLRVPAWAMSDGALRLLAQLAVLFSPTPPALVCLEEPENFIHPRLQELVADLLKSASRRTQILVSTHSPYLLNFLSPENLRVIEKVDGKTECKTVADQAGVKDALRVLGLGELWYSGNIGGVP